LYEKLAEIIDEDLVRSFIKNTKKYKYHSSFLKVPDFIKTKTFPETLSPIEKEFFRSYLILQTPNVGFSSAIDLIKQAIVSNDTELVEDIILTCADEILKRVSRLHGSSYIRELEKFCNQLIELAKENTEIRIVNGLRAFLRINAEKCHELIEQPENDYCYSLSTSHPEKAMCNCHLCVKIANFLQVSKESLSLRISDESKEHLIDQFQNDLESFRIVINKSLKDLLTITFTPWGTSEQEVLITKKPLISSQFAPVLLLKIDEILESLPISTKNARKRHPPPSEEEPAIKKQKTI